MSHETCQQEILLSYNSGFLFRICVDRANSETEGESMDAEKIEEACWDGLLKEEFPEIYHSGSRGRQLYIWEIRDYNSVMKIDIGEYPATKDDYLCIDPYKFMMTHLRKKHS
jgi:hypothetical protein